MKSRAGKVFASVAVALLLALAGMTLRSAGQVPVTLPSFTGGELPFPWSGGLNAGQFCALDLDLDGSDDLVLFDRHGNRAVPFLFRPSVAGGYAEAPGYAPLLPVMHDWLITADYDDDGRKDIFTYGLGGIRVFRNISTDTLTFRNVTDLLESFYYTGKVGILVTSVDYPAIGDIDGDGDLDLLTFFGLGSYVEFHKNLSVEKYGTPDSLDFTLADPCWGRFKESEGSNRITLNAPCPYESLKQEASQRVPDDRHTGSTLLLLDLDHNGLMDLVLGDMDYPDLVALYNGGTTDSARMTAIDTAFPPGDPVRLFSFPAAFHIDIDHDGLKDLVAAPFDPALQTAENYECAWYYRNTGTQETPQFSPVSRSFFRDRMMDFGSASHPVLFDMDGDGLTDLLVGNFGYYDSSWYYQAVLRSAYSSDIRYFRNTGTPGNPVFTYVPCPDLEGLRAAGLNGMYPAPGDLNSDGHADLVAGQADGTLMFLQNRGAGGEVPGFHSPVSNWMGIDVGDFSTPQVFDLDRDNLPDLVIGERNGNLNFYRNTGTPGSPAFTLVTDSLGRVNVTNPALSYYGYSTPCLARTPGDTTFLVTGSDEGRIRFFKDIDGNLGGTFKESAGLFDMVAGPTADTLFGWQVSPSLGHLTDATAFDMVAGNFSGGLRYLSKRSPATIVPGIGDPAIQYARKLHITPNPARFHARVSCSREASLLCSDLLTVVSADGRVRIDLPFDGEVTLQVAGLAPGVYLLRSGALTGRMVVAVN